MKYIPFNKPYLTGREIQYMEGSLQKGELSGNQSNSDKVTSFIKKKYCDSEVFLTPSCTAALEMGVLLSGVKPGDEVIMPSFTFSSTANSVMIFGARPVFCEVNPETMNLDVSKLKSLISSKTKMIIPIDYAGVPCDMDEIMTLAEKFNLIVMLDAAQSFGARYKNKPTGKDAHLICFSFHETKNLTCGEGGALLVNEKKWISKAKIIQEKGTDRARMLEGLQNKYSWVGTGSSYLLSDILAGMLVAQLEVEAEILEKRKNIFFKYKSTFKKFVKEGFLNDLYIPSYVNPNYHSYWLTFDKIENKELFITQMGFKGIPAYISYIPLHTSKMGSEIGYKDEDLPITKYSAQRLVRLPFYAGLSKDDQNYICDSALEILTEIYNPKIIQT